MWLLGQLMAGALALGQPGARETFEFVSFTPPPGWLVSHAEGGRQYIRNEASGTGLINFLPSRPATGDVAQLFADAWSTHAARIIAGPAPQPAVGSEGEVAVAVGIKEVGPQGTAARVVVVTFLWRGRTLSVIGMATGAERQAELQAFFGTLRAEPNAPTAAPSAPAPPPPSAPAGPGPGAGQLGFDVPPGYTQQRNGDIVILTPTASDRTPCIYGVAPPVAASGNLEADAEAALVRVVASGWRRLDDRHYAMRGISAAGWQYVWYRAAFEGEIGGQRQAVNAMAMVLPAGAGRVHVVWGIGSISRCLLDDATFEQLFHSLRPAGWTSDGGQALARALAGTWRYTASGGLQQLHFNADGRFERDLGSRASVGVMERTSTTATGGRFTLRNGELLLTPDHRPQNPDRYRVRLYDEWREGGWRRAIALLSPGDPPLVVPWYRVEVGR
ncbi:MAG TPA: hypothetical protein VFS20_31370 [Longimicrobium sp.]|nr:hypothetical protein [Longimicrobium sp.]